MTYAALKIIYQIIRLTIALMLAVLIGCSKEQPGNTAVISPDETSTVRYLVGSYTDGPDQGVYALTLDTTSGELSSLGLVAETHNPSYIALSEDQQTLFSVNEVETGGISAFTWNADAQRFDLKKSIQGVGYAPCYISLSPDGRWIAVANYMSGDVQLFSRAADDFLDLVDTHQHRGNGAHPRQEAPHPHWINWSPDGRYSYSVDLGIDQILAYQVTVDGFSDPQIAVTLEPGDGPRHLVFNTDLNVAYVVNELSNTVAVLTYDPESGALTPLQRVSTLSPEFDQHSQTAAIRISPDNKYVYASNRGANSIAVFSVRADGLLDLIQEHSTEGDWPRDFTLTADGNFVLVANERSGTVIALARNPQNGQLSSTGYSLDIHQPTALVSF